MFCFLIGAAAAVLGHQGARASLQVLGEYVRMMITSLTGSGKLEIIYSAPLAFICTVLVVSKYTR